MTPSPPIAPDAPNLAPASPSPSDLDRIDQPVVIVPIRSVVGLGACLVLATVVLIWALTADVARTASGRAVLLVDGVVTRVQTSTAGVVTAVPHRPGDAVPAGTVVAELRDGDDQLVRLTAPIDGVVLNINESVGATTAAGDVIVSMEPASGQRQLRMFLDPAMAEDVEVGTPAVLDFVGQDSATGYVSQVSALPMTRDQAAGSLGSAALAEALVPGDGTVAVTVLPDDPEALPASHPGVSSGGRTATVRLILDTAHPIEYMVR